MHTNTTSSVLWWQATTNVAVNRRVDVAACCVAVYGIVVVALCQCDCYSAL